MLEGTWGNAYGFGQVLYKATTLTFTGLAVGLGLRAGLFQHRSRESARGRRILHAALVGLALPAGLSAIVAFPVPDSRGRDRRWRRRWSPRHSEGQVLERTRVITTIMLNFVVLALLNYLVAAHFKVPDTLHTGEIHSGAVPRLSDLASRFHGSAANLTIVLAAVSVVATWWYLFRTRRGFELRAAGLQPEAARYGAIDVSGVWWRALAASGAIAGIGGVNFVAGYKHYYEEGFASGSGFPRHRRRHRRSQQPDRDRARPPSFSRRSRRVAFAVNALVPKQMVDVLQAVVILAVAAFRAGSPASPEGRQILMLAIAFIARYASRSLTSSRPPGASSLSDPV